MKKYLIPLSIQNIVHRSKQKLLFLQTMSWRAFMLSCCIFFGRNLNAQCVAPYMSFHSPVLIAGTDNQVGAVYLFPEVMPGVDANIKVAGFTGGAQLYNIDDSTGIGYYDAFQPYVVAPADSVSYVDWEITFKVAGTSNDTSLACFAITGVDVDGNGANLQEFIEAATPGSYALDPSTILNFSFDGTRSKAISLVDNIPSIDTAHREAMFQMNFTNISTLQYRNGAISTYGSDMVRQTCIYFKSFFDSYLLLLPVKIISFSGQPQKGTVALRWSATNENDLKYYIIQKSSNGINWTDAGTVLPGNGTVNNYIFNNAASNAVRTYYRLKQVTRGGNAVYSKALEVNDIVNAASITSSMVVNNTIGLQINTPVNDRYTIAVFAIGGDKVKQQNVSVSAGTNTLAIEMPAVAPTGLYVLTVINARGDLLYHSKLVKN